MIPALIGAGASLLGGIFGKPKRESAEQNSREAILGQAAGAREAAEKYGFNPLTLLGVSSAVGPSTTSNYMGQSIAEAGMIMADHLARQRNPGALSQLQAENEKLRQKVQNQTLRPRVGGIYAGTDTTPTIGARNARVVADAAAVAENSDRPYRFGEPVGLTAEIVAPGREREDMPVPNSAGVFELENSMTGGPLVIPGDNEPWGIDELLTAVVVGGPQAIWNHTRRFSNRIRAAGAAHRAYVNSYPARRQRRQATRRALRAIPDSQWPYPLGR